MSVIDTVGYSDEELGHFYDFYVNNVFYLLAPPYYFPFYSIYLNKALAAYDGWIGGFHNKKEGIVPQRMLQSVARGLNNMLFAHGIDFESENAEDYEFAIKWAKQSKFYKAIKKAHLFAIAGGTSLLKLNRADKELYATAHRIDTFFADIDAQGNIVSVRTYFDAIHNTNPSGNGSEHYGICEERYYNSEGKACIRAAVYKGSANLQTEVQARPVQIHRMKWENLPKDVKDYIKKNYPSIILDQEQYLPFAHNLGCRLLRFTEDIPQIPNTQFGQPIGDILYNENRAFDQMKLFERIEVKLAKARAAVPEEYWNKDDPNYGDHAIDETFYEKVNGMSSDTDKITFMQPQLRANDIKTQKETIYKDIAFKLNISASSVASFLSEGAGARTATEIVSERTKSDTWIDSQINLNKPEIDEIMRLVMLYYNHNPIGIVFKAEDQSPPLETVKAYGDQFSAGNMSPEMFVKKVYKNLSESEKAREIQFLKETAEAKNTIVPMQVKPNTGIN